MKNSEECFDTVTLLRGDKVSVFICRGWDIAKASFKHSIREKYLQDLDTTPFLMAELCTVNDDTKPVEYFLGLLSEDYIKILNIVGSVINEIKSN